MTFVMVGARPTGVEMASATIAPHGCGKTKSDCCFMLPEGLPWTSTGRVTH